MAQWVRELPVKHDGRSQIPIKSPAMHVKSWAGVYVHGILALRVRDRQTPGVC